MLGNSQTILGDVTMPAAVLENQKGENTVSTARKTQSAKPVRKMNIGNQTKGRQQYMRSQFSNMAVSYAVAVVLQRQPERVLEITPVVDAVFESQMPPAVRSLARHQVNSYSLEWGKSEQMVSPVAREL